MTFLRSSHDKTDPGLKDIMEEELERKIEDLDFSMDGEREMATNTYGKERVEDTLIAEDSLHMSKDTPLSDALPSRDSDVLSEALSDVKESPEFESAINNDKRHQSAQSQVLHDHLHYDVSADPALPTCSKDETSSGCKSSSPLPVAAELSGDVEMEVEATPVSVDYRKGKGIEGVRIAHAVNGDAEAIEDEALFNTDTAGDSEEAFKSISANSEAIPPDSSSDENLDMDSESEGDFLEGDEYENEDDYEFNLSQLSDSDDSSDSEMMHMNEAEHDNLGYASSSDEYDTDTSSDEEGEEDEEKEDKEDKLPADVGFDVEGEVEGEAKVWNGEQDDSKVVIQSQFTHA